MEVGCWQNKPIFHSKTYNDQADWIPPRMHCIPKYFMEHPESRPVLIRYWSTCLIKSSRSNLENSPTSLLQYNRHTTKIASSDNRKTRIEFSCFVYSDSLCGAAIFRVMLFGLEFLKARFRKTRLSTFRKQKASWGPLQVLQISVCIKWLIRLFFFSFDVLFVFTLK